MKHKHTPLRLALVLLLCLCSLNACSLLDEFSPDTILQAPRLTGADGQIQEAFEEAVGTNVVLVNPVGGEYRSAYLRFDMDRDGADEILIFYAKAESPADIRIHFLRKDAHGNWMSFGDVAGNGSQISKVEFFSFADKDCLDVLVSWTFPDAKRNKNLVAYRMTRGGKTPQIELITANQVVEYLVLDVDNDERKELLCFVDEITEDERNMKVSLIKYDESNQANLNEKNEWTKFSTLSEVALSKKVDLPERITYEKRGEGTEQHYCIYVDCRCNDSTYMTEILDYKKTEERPPVPVTEEGATGEAPPEETTAPAPPPEEPTDKPTHSLVRPLTPEGTFLCETTVRTPAVYCQQVKPAEGGEARILVPLQKVYEGSVIRDRALDDKQTEMQYIVLSRYEDDAFLDTESARFYDPSMRFSFRLDALLASYTAVYQTYGNLLSFYMKEDPKKLVLTVDFETFLEKPDENCITIPDTAPDFITEEAVRKWMTNLKKGAA